MTSVTLTGRMVVSILAELYDPRGFWEPWKLQLMLLSQKLVGIDWDGYIFVKHQLSKLVDFHKVSVPRICIPLDKY